MVAIGAASNDVDNRKLQIGNDDEPIPLLPLDYKRSARNCALTKNASKTGNHYVDRLF